ncbi:hypothetical protein G6M89_00040 [Natronolimnobius sp. AArcel1]|nr:hypothetical protein [Natronolimnobius sp. AArcel1]
MFVAVRFDSGRARMSSDGAYRHHSLPIDVTPVQLERALWVLVAISLVGDVVTTFVGLHLGLAESNPIARGAIEGYGLAGMLVLKAFAIGVGLVCRPLLPRAYRPIVPAGLALPWLLAVFINMYMISLVI